MTVRRCVLLAALAIALVTACEPATVTVEFRPTTGATYRYRYEITADVTRQLAGERAVTTHTVSAIEARETVRSVRGGEARVEVVLARDGAAERTVEVRLDRADQLAGIDLVEGVPVAALGMINLADLFPVAAAPPKRPLSPGERWHIDEAIELATTGGPTRATGEGRLDRLGVVDGHDVATVVTAVLVPLSTTTDTGDGVAHIAGVQRTRADATYDLGDGAVRSASSTSTGDVTLTIEPPQGFIGAPVDGTLRYAIRVITRRIS